MYLSQTPILYNNNNVEIKTSAYASTVECQTRSVRNEKYGGCEIHVQLMLFELWEGYEGTMNIDADNLVS